jgi:hypothetical protein
MYDSFSGSWSIGPIAGMYQPEDFTEKQSLDYAEPPTFGTVSPLIFKKWSPREVTLSFVVNALCIPDEEEVGNFYTQHAPQQSDPEIVWATILSMMRKQPTNRPRGTGNRGVIAVKVGAAANNNSSLPPVLGDEPYPRVTIPGWGIGNGPTRAVITDATFKRTHISGNPPRCVRGVITVSLKEMRLGVPQRGFTKSEAGLGGEGTQGGLAVDESLQNFQPAPFVGGG